MIPRFRKSHLEQRATIIKLRTASTKKNFRIFLILYISLGRKHSHSLLFGLIRPPPFQTAPFGLKIWGRQLTTYPNNFQGGGFAYIYYFRTIRGEMYRALTRQTHHFCLHLWKLGKEKTLLFSSLKVFLVFDSTKVCWKQQKQNKQTLSFILHQKSSKTTY